MHLVTVVRSSIAIPVRVNPLHLLGEHRRVTLLLEDLNLFHQVLVDFLLLLVLVHHSLDLLLELIVDGQVLPSAGQSIHFLVFGEQVILQLEECLEAYPLKITFELIILVLQIVDELIFYLDFALRLNKFVLHYLQFHSIFHLYFFDLFLFC